MEHSPLPFASLFLFDHRTGAPATEVPILFQTTIGCFAAHPDTPSYLMPGYLTVNFYLKTAIFKDFEATARAKRLGILLKLPLLAGSIGVLAMVVAVILEMDAPIWSEGLWANGIFPFGLAVLASAIAFSALILAIGGYSSAAGWRSMIEIPEPIFSDLCEKYESLQLSINEFSENSAKIRSFGDEVKMSFAKSTAETIAGSIMPKGLANLAVHMATESKDSDDRAKSIDQLKLLGVEEMHQQVRHQYEILTGRKVLLISQSDFQKSSRITASKLLELFD